MNKIGVQGFYGIYSRKSKFTGKGESIGNQVGFCRNHIRMLNSEVTDEDMLVFEDEGFSGGNTNRPEFKKMMKLCREKKIHTVVCYRLDRISRNVSDFVKLIEELNKYHISFISVNEQFDTRTPMGRTMMMLCSIFSQLERETIAERIRDNMNELAKTGRWLGGETPAGYKSVEIASGTAHNGRVRKMYKLEPIEEEIKVVALIYKKFLETNSLSQVESYLLINNIKTKRGNEFSRFSIKFILQNPVYMRADKMAWKYFLEEEVLPCAEMEEFEGSFGIMAFNKTKQVAGSLSHDCNAICDWIIAVGRHNPIIESNEWIKVQKMLKQNKMKSYRKPRNNIALLSGILRCENCGSYLRPKTDRGLMMNGDKKFHYLCEKKEKTHMEFCKIKNPQGNLLDELVCREIKLLGENPSEFIKQLKHAKREVGSTNLDFERERKVRREKIDKNKKEIANFISTLGKAEGTPAYDYVFEEINRMHSENKELNKQIEQLTQNNEKMGNHENQLDAVKDIMLSFSHSFETMDLEQKRSSLRILIEKIEWDGEKADIYLFGAHHKNKHYSNEPLSENCK